MATIGPGKYSLDWVIGLEPAFDPNSGLGLSAGLGIASGIGLLAGRYRPPPARADRRGRLTDGCEPRRPESGRAGRAAALEDEEMRAADGRRPGRRGRATRQRLLDCTATC